ncbi:MAG: class I SAM-dependent methyltransferase [Bacteroidota bacterium]|nr:class I SAM-dependent methyltransferase [Bacteroidota bacterium]MDP4231962.1 class I SAM-dependent methyltransferase [Bacteroidota bacterium]MDP4241331.1 class I SAM-dependent methyltransferase [Bacteroidota bacterium]MDP4287252.1 class I SAM-dependent methyltransferase [Bacteroidota bacterium]
MSWYKDWFRDSNYRVVYEHRDESEAETMIDLIEKTIGHKTRRRVLDLACGSGRHALSFARRGYANVTGVDLSPTLLAEARDNAKSEGLLVEFLERDMRDLPQQTFDLAVNLFTSFGYFESDEENASVIKAVAEHLSANGYFVIDFFNSAWVQTHHVAHDVRVLPSGVVLDQSRWTEHGRVEKRLVLREPNSTEAHEFIESVRMFELADFERMFAGAGLTLQWTFGSYSGESYDRDQSERLIMFARR